MRHGLASIFNWTESAKPSRTRRLSLELSQIDVRLIANNCPGLSLGPHLKFGGQKAVWRCAYAGGAYVLKAITSSDRSLRRIVREIEIMQKCRSPYLPVFGPLSMQELTVGPDESVLYFLEEYIDGLPLASIHVPMAQEQIVWLGRCVAEALKVLAEHGYVHRDVKPMNVMQKTASTYVLIDAGLALDLDGDGISVIGARPVGTPLYYSPEQMRLPSRELDVRSDLFSLGVIMYQCATGEHPFWNDELPRVDALGNILNLEAPNPDLFVPTLSDDLCFVISGLLEKDRDKRCPTPARLLEDLAALQVTSQSDRPDL
jgi:eukaryotic-like serine/threonine-protein kinase